MKKLLFTGAVITFVLSFSGCKFFQALFSGAKNSFTYENVKELKYGKITESGTFKIPETVDLTDNVFVIQVNTGKSSVDKSGTLKNELSEEDDIFAGVDFERSTADSEELPVINEVPAFVRNFKGFPKVPGANYSMKARAASNPDIGEKVINILLPTDNSASPDFNPDTAKLKYTSKHAYVYYVPTVAFLYDSEAEDSGQSLMDSYLKDSDFEKIGKTFDNIYKAETSLLGSNKFSSLFGDQISYNSDKISIVISDIYCDSTENQKSGTFGYFYPNDFYCGDGAEDISNQTEVIYIDSVLYKNCPDLTLSTLAHEFAHLLNYCNKEMKKVCDDEETWYTEMMAMVTEELMYTDYVNTSASDSNQVSKVRIPYYCKSSNIGFTAWNDANVYENYGNIFTYGSFLARNYGGINLIHEIATNNASETESITAALQKCGQDATFTDTLISFAVNSMNAKTKKSDVITLNKAVSGTINGYDFDGSALDITKHGGMTIQKNKNVTSLGSTGFTIQYAGKGTKNLDVTLSDNKNVEMFYVIQSVE